MKKIIFTALPILWMLLIFTFSAAPADDSSKLSMSVGRIIADTFVWNFDEWSDADQEEFVGRIDYPVRKCAHASEYAVLGVLLMLAFWNYSTESSKDNYVDGCKDSPGDGCMDIKKSICGPGIIGAVYAASDEFHQLFVPGRACRVTDVMIDCLGLMAGIFLVYIIRKLYVKTCKKPLKTLDNADFS